MFIPLQQAPSASLRPADSAITKGDWAVLADRWYPVAVAADVKSDRPLAARLLDVDLVLFRDTQGAAAALLDLCPHRHVRLSIGTVKDGQISCAFHGMRFEGSGQCSFVPALGERGRLPRSYSAHPIPVREHLGLVWACLGHADRHPVPRFPQLEALPVAEVEILPVLEWPVSAARQIENFFDLAHLPFVHAATLGGDPVARIAPGRVEQVEDGVILHACYRETAHGEHDCDYTYRVLLPFAIEFDVRYRPSPDRVLVSADIASPVSAHRCRVFQLLHVAGGPEARAAMAAGLGVVNNEDIAVLATLQRPDLPLDQRHELHLPVDNISHAYRTRLRDLGLGR